MAQLISNAIVTTVFHIGSFSINSIYSTTEFLINGSNAHISERIEKIDIVNKIKIIEAFISEVTTNCSLKYKKSIHLALESIQSIIDKMKVSDKLLFVFGSEGKGIRRLIKKNCSFTASIPNAPNTQSINVSNAAAIIFYESFKINNKFQFL